MFEVKEPAQDMGSVSNFVVQVFPFCSELVDHFLRSLMLVGIQLASVKGTLARSTLSHTRRQAS